MPKCCCSRILALTDCSGRASLPPQQQQAWLLAGCREGMVPKKGDSLLLEHEGRQDGQSCFLSVQGWVEAVAPQRLHPQDASAAEVGGSRALQSR